MNNALTAALDRVSSAAFDLAHASDEDFILANRAFDFYVEAARDAGANPGLIASAAHDGRYPHYFRD